MTRKEFKKSVSQFAKEVLKKRGSIYRDVKINLSLPTISFGDFFVQGESAEQLIAEAPKDINLRTWLLFYLDGAGAI